MPRESGRGVVAGGEKTKVSRFAGNCRVGGLNISWKGSQGGGGGGKQTRKECCEKEGCSAKRYCLLPEIFSLRAMSGNTDVVAGPEVDMAEMEGASSSSVIPNSVDLSLNLGPRPAPRDRLALVLALGGQNSEGSVQAPRQNWPRFEPGIQEDEVPAMEENHPSLVLVNFRPQEIEGTQDRTSPSRAPSQESGSAQRGIEPFGTDRSREELPLSVVRQRFLRNLRHSRYLRRTRQTLASVLDRVDSQASSGDRFSTEARIDGTDDSRSPFILPRGTVTEIRRNRGTVTACADIPSAKALVSSSESKSEDAKETESGHVGAHFECNICLEVATDPVVTCCGHLFCWPCLYQWLHVHSIQKECPVCKGFLSDGFITPIYGRGTVQGTEVSLGNIPPRPQAHRLSGKRHHQDIIIQERLDGDVRLAGGRSEVEERSEREGSNASDVILNRLRVAERLQREYLRQRMMGRRGRTIHTRFPIGATAQAGLTSPQVGTRDAEQRHRDQMVHRMAMNRLDTNAGLAVIQARVEGLREDLANMQRSVHIANHPPEQIGTSLSQEGTSSGVADLTAPFTVEERISPPRTESAMQEISTNADVPPQQDPAGMPQAAWREWYRAARGASRSFDIEPGSLHSRKRRRLN